MPGEKRFKTSPFGFNKSDVNSYIEKMLREFEDKLKQKDEEISILTSQIRDIKAKYEEFTVQSNQIREDREKIVAVLVKAQEQAQSILEEARKQSLEERKKLEEINEREKEKIVDMKEKVKYLRGEVVDTLRGFEESLSTVVVEETVKG